MASRAADTYESQNDQQLDALHSKIRTLRGVRVILPTNSFHLRFH